MSISAGAAALGSAAISALSGAGQAVATGRLNKRNRQWQEDMYQKQRNDNRADWERQNAYNLKMYQDYQSPQAQMRQIKEAGLNPYLMYSNGAGGVGGITPSQKIDSSSVGNPQQYNPADHFSQVGNSVQNAMNYVLQARTANAQQANLQANTAHTTASTQTEKANTIKTLTETKAIYENMLNQKNLTASQVSKYQAEIKKIDNDIEIANRSIDLQTQQVTNQTQQVAYQAQELDIKRLQYQLQTKQYNLDAQRVAQGWKNLSQQEANNVVERSLKQKLSTSEAQKAINLTAEYYNILKREKLTDAEIKQKMSQIQLIDAQKWNTIIQSGKSLKDIINPFK